MCSKGKYQIAKQNSNNSKEMDIFPLSQIKSPCLTSALFKQPTNFNVIDYV